MFTVTGMHGSYSVQDDVLSKGGVGSIHRTTDPDFVYKKYFSPDKAPSRAHLEVLVAVGREVLINQGRKPGESPESSVNWPVDIVLDSTGNGVIGVVLPLIPDALFNPDLGGVRGLEFLVMARAKPPTAKARIVLLLRMAEILAFVNARKLIHGDINGKNLAWSIAPAPVMYLIDCDGMVPQDPPPTTGVQAMGWTDPRIVEGRVKAHDQYSDWYALALAMYRGLLLTSGNLQRKPDGSWPEPGQIPPGFPPALATLIRRGLDPLAQTRRPTPKEWVDALKNEYLPGRQFNETSIAALDAMSAPVPKVDPFIPIPHFDPNSVSSSQYNPPPPRPPVVNPTPPPPPPPPVSPVRTPPAPNSNWQNSNWRQPTRTVGPSGGLAQAALQRGGSWYGLGLAATLFLPPLALIYVLIAFFQLKDVDDSYPGVTTARNALIGFGAASAFILLIFIVGSATS